MVFSHVLAQVAALIRAVRTVSTGKGFVASVQPNVVPDMGRVRCNVVAETTEQHKLVGIRQAALPNVSRVKSPPRDALRRK